MIDKALKLECPDPAETYSSSPHLYTELNIPTEAGGSIGAARKSQGAKSPSKAQDGTRISSTDSNRERPSRNRSRRRTRGGQGATGHVETTDAPADGAPVKAEGGDDSPARKRRRRRRPRNTAEAPATAG